MGVTPISRAPRKRSTCFGFPRLSPASIVKSQAGPFIYVEKAIGRSARGRKPERGNIDLFHFEDRLRYAFATRLVAAAQEFLHDGRSNRHDKPYLSLSQPHCSAFGSAESFPKSNRSPPACRKVR